MKRWILLGGAALAVVGVVAVTLFLLREWGPPPEKRGSETVEFVSTDRPAAERPTPPGPATPKELELPWPTYGYDPARSHLSPYSHRPPFRRAWMLRSGFYVEFPPTIGYGRVFVSQLKGRFFALDPPTGKVLWRKRFGFCSAASPGLGAGLVIQAFVAAPCNYGPRDRPGLVVAMRPSNGRIVWKRPISSESSVVVVGRRAYLGAWNGSVYALDAKTGRTIWRTPTDGEINSSPALSGSLLVIGTNAGSVYGLDARTGAIRWRARSHSSLLRGREYFYATPTIAYGRVYAPNTDGLVYAFGAGTGNLLWASRVGTYVYTAPAVWQRKVFVGTYDGKFLALDAATGDTVWSVDTVGSVHGAPTVMDGLVYYASCGTCGQRGVRDAKLGPRGTFALDARTGRQVWSFPDGHYSPVVADEKRVYLVGSTRVYGLEPRSR